MSDGEYFNTPEQFARRLQEGHYNELRVALYFMLQGYHVRIGYTGHAYDLSVIGPEGDAFTVEVKWDKRAGETGNLYFEIRNTRQRRPSGIAASRADYWCHVIGEGDEALLVPVSTLRAFLRDGGFEKVRTRGRDSNSQGLLVPRARLADLKDGQWIRLPTVEDFFGAIFFSFTSRGASMPT